MILSERNKGKNMAMNSHICKFFKLCRLLFFLLRPRDGGDHVQMSKISLTKKKGKIDGYDRFLKINRHSRNFEQPVKIIPL